jgi:chemotaxis protein histidine kinase CheA
MSSAPEESTEKRAFEIGWEFVQEYYTIMHHEPESLYKFYGNNSYFCYGLEGESTQYYHGKDEIRKRIENIDYNECRVVVSNVDSQPSNNGGIIVQVLGEMLNRDDQAIKFTQTFFLAVQQNGYYVLNDIFRNLKDEVNEECEELIQQAEEEKEEQEQQQEEEEEEEVKEEPKVEAPAKPEKQEVKEAKQEKTKEAKTSPAKEKKSTNETDANKSQNTNKSQTTNKSQATNKPQSGKTQGTKSQATPAQKSAPAKEAAPATKEAPAEASKPTAAKVAANATTTAEKPAATTSDSTTATTTNAAASAPARPITYSSVVSTSNSTAKTWNKVAQGDSNKASVVIRQTVSTAPPKHQDNRNNNNNNNQDKDSYTVFIKLPFNISKDEISNALSKFGDIKNIEINGQKNYAFVEFATVEQARKAVQGGEFTIRGAKINIEERKRNNKNHGNGRMNSSYNRGGRSDYNRNFSGGSRGSNDSNNMGNRRGGSNNGKLIYKN